MEQIIGTLTHSLLHFTILSVTIMSAMPGPIPGSHTASHELTRIYTLTIHDATHLPLCASTGGGLGAILSLPFSPFRSPPTKATLTRTSDATDTNVKTPLRRC